MTATTRKGLYATLIAGLLLLGSEAHAGWVNGWWVYPFKNFSNRTLTYRPWSASEHGKGVCISDWRVSNLPTMNKGVQIGYTNTGGTSGWVYRWIAMWHMEISDAWRVPGGHVDFIRIYGNGNNQPFPTSVLLQDIQIHDGDAIPILIQDGWFDKITLKKIRIWKTTVGVQLCTINTGRIDSIVIEDCPNISVAVMGRPGSIGTVYVKNSPGIRIADTPNAKGLSGAKIIFLN